MWPFRQRTIKCRNVKIQFYHQIYVQKVFWKCFFVDFKGELFVLGFFWVGLWKDTASISLIEWSLNQKIVYNWLHIFSITNFGGVSEQHIFLGDSFNSKKSWKNRTEGWDLSNVCFLNTNTSFSLGATNSFDCKELSISDNIYVSLNITKKYKDSSEISKSCSQYQWGLYRYLLVCWQ